MKCPNCGFINPNNSMFCSNCGCNLQNSQNNINNNSNMNNNMNNNSNNNIIKIIVIVVVIFAILGLIAFLINSSNDEKKTKLNNTTSSINEEDTSEITDEESDIPTTSSSGKGKYLNIDLSNIKVSKKDDSKYDVDIKNIFYNYKKGNNDFVNVYGVNNNNFDVIVDLSLDYYDSEHYRIDKDTSFTMVKANSEFVINMNTYGYPLDYKTIELNYNVLDTRTYYKSVDLSNNKLDKFKNSSGPYFVVALNDNQEVEYSSGACLYYKNNNLVYASYSLGDVSSGNITYQCYDLELEDNNYDILPEYQYDDVKFVIYNSYSTKEDY